MRRRRKKPLVIVAVTLVVAATFGYDATITLIVKVVHFFF